MSLYQDEPANITVKKTVKKNNATGGQSLTTAATTTCNQTSSTQYEGTSLFGSSSGTRNPANSRRTRNPRARERNSATTLQSFFVNSLKNMSLSRLVVGEDGESVATNACWCRSLGGFFNGDDDDQVAFDDDDHIVYSTKLCHTATKSQRRSNDVLATHNHHEREEKSDESTAPAHEDEPAKQQQQQGALEHSVRSIDDQLTIMGMQVTVYKPKADNIFVGGQVHDHPEPSLESDTPALAPPMEAPKLKIVWNVERSQEMGLVDKWTGRLLILRNNHSDDAAAGEGENEIGWITIYGVNSQIARQSVITDVGVRSFVDEFLIPNTILPRQPSVDMAGDGDEIPLFTIPSIGSMTFAESQPNKAGSDNNNNSTVNEGSASLDIFPSFSMVEDVNNTSRQDRVVFLVSDITLQPKFRGSGLGLVMLDAACNQIAEESSLVVVSLREAVDDTLQKYFGLLGFVLAPQGEVTPSRPSSPLGALPRSGAAVTVGIAEMDHPETNFLMRRNGPHCPFIENICPYFPTAIETTIASDF